MKSTVRYAKNAVLIAFGFGAFVAACAPVKFDSSPAPKTPALSCNSSGRPCVEEPGINSFDYSITVESGKGDVLFAIDNTASMSPIQNEINLRFPNFIQGLGALQYRIAVVTTDVAKDAGRLVTMIDGSKYISPTTTNPQGAFEAAIKRNETLTCEQYLRERNCSNNECSDYSNYCPSEDSRAIYAANLVVGRGTSEFLRDNIPLSVIIVSNGDSRASGGRDSDGRYPLTADDYPSSLIQRVNSTFASSKSLRVHSIIVPDGDTGCLNAQRVNYGANSLFGWEGRIYQQLTQATGGTVGSVCAGNYTAQLGQIASTIVNQPASIDLPCAPISGTFQITLTPSDSGANPQLSGSRVQFARQLAQGTTARLVFSCRN